MTMDRDKLLKDIQQAYKAWSKETEFTTLEGASDEDENKILDQIQTLLDKTKQQFIIKTLSLRHGGYCT